MGKFIVNLFSNRFGIVLAALNLCCYAAKAPALFNHPRGFFSWISSSLNSPAIIAAGISHVILREFSPVLSYATLNMLLSVWVAFFIVLQWLFIAWIAKTLGARIAKNRYSAR